MLGKKKDFKKKEEVVSKNTVETVSSVEKSEDNVSIVGVYKETNKKRKKGERVTKKDPLLKRIAKRYNFKYLKSTVESYGYSYSLKNFLIQFFVMVAVVMGFSYYLQLHPVSFVVLIVELVIAFPFIIDAQFNQLHQIHRFEMVTNYLDNLLPIFKNKPKIYSAWSEVLDLVDDEMRESLEQAIHYTMNSSDDPDVENTAFKFIEEKFPNSRVHSVHQMMYTIEKKNSENYQASIDNMYFDVQAWIQRVYKFQKDIAKYRKDLIILCLFGLICSCFSVGIFGDNELFVGYTDNTMYQVATTLYVGAMILCVCLSYIKLNGAWLTNDRTIDREDTYYKSFEYLKKHPREELEKQQKKLYIVGGLIIAAGVGMYFMNPANFNLLMMCAFLGFLVATQKSRTWKMHHNKVKFFLEVEFPIWMRDVALNLNNYTLVNAIVQSKETCSVLMGYYINEFLAEVYKKPSSIEPYNEYLDEFTIEGVKSSMKVLYSLKNLDKNQSQEQVNSLIIRNQTLLERSENLRNEDVLGGVKLLGFVPTMLVMLHLVVSMGVLFSFLITKLMGMI